MSTHDEDGLTTGSDPASGVDPFATLDKRRRGVRVTYAAAVALGLAIGGGAIAGAATGSTSSTTPPSNSAGGPAGHFGFGGTPPAAFGTVASVGVDTFTVTTRDGTKVTVDVNGATTYMDPSVTTPSFTDVKVGDHVAVFGTDSSNTVTATSVALGGPGGPGGPGGNGPGGFGAHRAFGGTPPAAFGTVASVGADTFTLSTIDGTKVTVDVSGTTTYTDPGVTTPSFTDVKVGDHVAVFGSDSSNTVTATKVALGGPEGDGPGGFGGHRAFGGTPPAAVGTVASVGTNRFVVTSPDGTKVTVDVGSSTSYMEFGKTSASIADVTVGAHVGVFGTDANNTVTATKVGIANPTAGQGGPGRPGGPWGPGGNRGPDGMGGWPSAPSGASGSSGAASSSPGTASSSSGTATSSGGTLN